MTAYVTIPVASVENALKVPNTALRYKPPMSLEEVRAVYAKYGIDAGPPPSRTEVARPAGGPEESGAKNAPRSPARDVAVVWKRHSKNNAMEPVEISLGITDHSYTEVTGFLKGTLKEGDDIIVRSAISGPQAPAGIRK
jgi:HlyD family secretion protein